MCGLLGMILSACALTPAPTTINSEPATAPLPSAKPHVQNAYRLNRQSPKVAKKPALEPRPKVLPIKGLGIHPTLDPEEGPEVLPAPKS